MALSDMISYRRDKVGIYNLATRLTHKALDHTTPESSRHHQVKAHEVGA